MAIPAPSTNAADSARAAHPLDGFSVPAPPLWYGNAQSVCTPNGGLLYTTQSRTRIAYLPPPASSAAVAQRPLAVQPHSAIKAFDCDPLWTASSQLVVCLDADHILSVFNLAGSTGTGTGASSTATAGPIIVAKCKVHNPDFSRSHGGRGGRRTFHKTRPMPDVGTVCVMRQTRQVLSNVGNVWSLWCLASNTYTTFAVDVQFERDRIVLMRSSPYAAELVAVGTQRGLVVVVDVRAKRVVQRLRGHDKQITALEWMAVTMPSTAAVATGTSAAQVAAADPTAAAQTTAAAAAASHRPRLQASAAASPATVAGRAEERRLRGALRTVVDADDVFDIYEEYDDAVDQFGVATRPQYATPAEHAAELERLRTLSVEEKAVGNVDFDFVEACQSLKEEIVAAKTAERDEEPQRRSAESDESIAAEFEKLSLPAAEDAERSSSAGADAGGRDSDEETTVTATTAVNVMVNSTDASFMSVVAVEAKHDGTAESRQAPAGDSKRVFLASGAVEPVVWLWDIGLGAASQKIELKPAGKSANIPTTQTTIAWLTEHSLILNTPNGDVVTYDIAATDEGSLKISVAAVQPESIAAQRSVVAVIKHAPIDGGQPHFWTKNIGHDIVCTSADGQVLLSFGTAAVPQMALAESPHDPTVVAMSGLGRRLQLLQLSTLSAERVHMQSFTGKMQAKVLSLAWHPERPDLLAYGTEEGRVGVYDVSRQSNMPMVVHPFTSQSVYQLAWAKVRILKSTSTPPTTAGAAEAAADEKAADTEAVKPEASAEVSGESEDQWVLFACAKGFMYYIPYDGHKTLVAVRIIEQVGLMSVGANSDYIACGTEDGHVFVYTAALRGRIFAQRLFLRKCTRRYVSECAFSAVRPQRLAVAASDAGIHVLDCPPAAAGPAEPQLVCELLGHAGVTMVRWSSESAARLVSCGFDCTVRVWSLLTDETTAETTGSCVALVQYTAIMCSALFVPTDERLVMACGVIEPVHVFDIGRHAAGVADKSLVQRGVSKATPVINDFQWARAVQTDATQLAKSEKSRNRRVAGAGRGGKSAQGAGGDAAEDGEPRVQHAFIGDVYAAVLPDGDVQSFNYTTICHVSGKEFNKEALTLLQQVAQGQQVTPAPQEEGDSATGEEKKPLLNHRLFGSRDEVRELLHAELQNHQHSRTDSIAHVAIPVLCDELEPEIRRRIELKQLSERQLAIAPLVSYKFWVECCKAYAAQMLELGAPLQALPYLLAQQQTDDAIAELCKSHYYREAWIVAKIGCEPGDRHFAEISAKWIEHLRSNGQLEGAAFVAASAGDRATAVKILLDKSNQTPAIEAIIRQLQSNDGGDVVAAAQP